MTISSNFLSLFRCISSVRSDPFLAPNWNYTLLRSPRERRTSSAINGESLRSSNRLGSRSSRSRYFEAVRRFFSLAYVTFPAVAAVLTARYVAETPCRPRRKDTRVQYQPRAGSTFPVLHKELGDSEPVRRNCPRHPDPGLPVTATATATATAARGASQTRSCIPELAAPTSERIVIN